MRATDGSKLWSNKPVEVEGDHDWADSQPIVVGEPIRSPHREGRSIPRQLCYLSYERYRQISALNAANGRVVWTTSIGGEKSSYARLTYSNGVLFAHTLLGDICVLNLANGDILWTRIISHFSTAPTLADGGFFVGSFDGTMFRLDASSGVILWNHTVGLFQNSEIYSWSWGSAVVGEAVYCRAWMHGVVDGKDKYLYPVYAFDKVSGAEMWNSTTESYTNTIPVLGDGLVYFGLDGGVYALDAVSGAEVWNFKSGRYGVITPMVVDGTLYAGFGEGVYALDAADGVEIWNYTTDDAIRNFIVADGVVYGISLQGALTIHVLGNTQSVVPTPGGSQVEDFIPALILIVVVAMVAVGLLLYFRKSKKDDE